MVNYDHRPRCRTEQLVLTFVSVELAMQAQIISIRIIVDWVRKLASGLAG
jgi:hypothetical protein